MSISAPFVVSSKCVMRSNYDPHVIVEKSDCDDKPFENSSQACGSQNPESKSRSNMMMLSSGRAESGWISRNEEDDLLVTQPSSNNSRSNADVKSQSSPDQVEDPTLMKQSQDLGLFPVARRRLLSLHDLPHPSKLRKMGSAGAKMRREREKDQLVQKHIQQLKKKKAAYYVTESVTRTPAEGDTELTAVPLPTAPKTDICIPSALPAQFTSPAAAVEAGVGGEVAAVPATDVPLAEDDDERWFKTRWKTRHHTAANRASEE